MDLNEATKKDIHYYLGTWRNFAKVMRYIRKAYNGTKLTDEERQIFELYHMDGKSVAEIAESLGKSESKVREMLNTTNRRVSIQFLVNY